MPWSLLEKMKIPGSAGRRAGTGRSPGRYYAPFAAFNEYVPGSYFCYGLFLPFGCSGSDHPFRYRPFRLVFRGTEKALEEGTMEYAGKYSAPDYERIVDKSCSLAIESTMIYHCPQVKEQLENLGVPVLVERSSYEADPLGRMEWIKLYGVLTGKEQLAEELFEKGIKELENVSVQADEGQEHSDQTNQGKTVAFYITSRAVPMCVSREIMWQK